MSLAVFQVPADTLAGDDPRSARITSGECGSTPLTDAAETPGLDGTSAAVSLEHLTAGVAAGQADAVVGFYSRYLPVLYAAARRATGRDEAFCLDVVHDGFLRIARTLRPVGDERRLLAWMRLVVRTVAYDHLKAERRRTKRESAAAVVATIQASPHTTIADDEANRARLAWLRRQLDGLDPRLAELIDLRYTRGWTLARIGSLLGLTAGTVDGRLRRALADLRRRAAAELPDLETGDDHAH